MRNTLRFGLFAALATLSLSCTKESVEPTVNGNEKVQMTFTATNGAVTKTYLEGNAVKWHDSDAISIFDGYSALADATKNQKFTISAINPDGSATFTGAAAAQDIYYATYPYDTGNYLKEGDIIRIGFKSTQKASTPGTFDQTYNPSAAIVKDGVLNFQNLGGLLKFTLSQNNVKKVTLSAADGGTIGGVYYVTFDENGAIQAELASTRNSMALESDGAANFAPGTYYFALSARTYTGGLSISFTLDNSKVLTAATTEDVVVERSKITNIGTFDTTYQEEETTFTPVTFPVVFPMGHNADNVAYNNPTVASNTWVQEWYNDDACSASGKTTHKKTDWTGHHGTLYCKDQPQATMKWVWDEKIASLGVVHFIETTNSASSKISTVGIKGIWTDDYFEFVLPVKDFDAYTTLSLTMALYTRQGPTFWEVLYLDGETWKSTAVDNLPAYAGAEVTARATWAIPYLAASSTTDNEQYVEMLFENSIKQGEIKIRVKCVDGSILSSGANAVTTGATGPYGGATAGAPFYIWNPGKRDSHDIVIDIVNI